MTTLLVRGGEGFSPILQLTSGEVFFNLIILQIYKINETDFILFFVNKIGKINKTAIALVVCIVICFRVHKSREKRLSS